MKLPEAVRKVGRINSSRILYIEDYALQYLKLCREKSIKDQTALSEETEILLYGERIVRGAGEGYIIHLAMPPSEYEAFIRSSNSLRQAKPSFSPEGHGDKRDTEKGICDFGLLGRMDMEAWKAGEDECQGILLGSGQDGQAVEGYYVFYGNNVEMKEYLGKCYEADLQRERIGQCLPLLESRPSDEKKNKLPELVALSERKKTRKLSVYFQIRIAVLCILTIICAIAATTVNGYEKLNDFIQKAAYTSRIMEESAGD